MMRTGMLLAILVFGLVFTVPHGAGSWNDGSRLALAESLADYQTLAIDSSVFLKPDPETPPYLPDVAANSEGTKDKLRIRGRWYSDKSPVPSVLAAGIQKIRRAVGAPPVREAPRDFAQFVTQILGVGSLLVAVLCQRRVNRLLGLTEFWAFFLVFILGFGTVAAAYSQFFNAHGMALAPNAVIALLLMLRLENKSSRITTAFGVGLSAGYGYSLDLGLGPGLVVAAGMAIVVCERSFKMLIVYGLGVLPFFMLHHAINYVIGGTFGPANAVPEYLAWPDSPFTQETMTGGMKHSFGGAILYSLDLLLGKKGFLLHNPGLWLLPGGVIYLLQDCHKLGLRLQVPLVFMVVYCGLGFAAYALTSNNLSGQCLSIRWFVPFLVPGFWLVALLLRERPAFRRDFLVLGGYSLVLGSLMLAIGPWTPRMVPLFWYLTACGFLLWLIVRLTDPAGFFSRRKVEETVENRHSKTAIECSA